MNKKIEFHTYKNNKLVNVINVPEPNNVFEKSYVDLALKYKIIELPIEYYQNNLAGLKLRKSLKLTDKQKELVYNYSKINDDEHFVLELIDFEDLKAKSFTFEGKTAILGFVNILKDANMDSLEDLLNTFEELKSDISQSKINELKIIFYCE